MLLRLEFVGEFYKNRSIGGCALCESGSDRLGVLRKCVSDNGLINMQNTGELGNCLCLRLESTAKGLC